MERWNTQHWIIRCVLHLHEWYCHQFYAQSSSLLLNQMVIQFSCALEEKARFWFCLIAGDLHLLSAKIFPPFLERL